MAKIVGYVVADDGTMTPVREGESATQAQSADRSVDYASWKKDQLEAEVDRRNEDREDDDLIEVEAPGNKAELVAALQADDAARAE